MIQSLELGEDGVTYGWDAQTSITYEAELDERGAFVITDVVPNPYWVHYTRDKLSYQQLPVAGGMVAIVEAGQVLDLGDIVRTALPGPTATPFEMMEEAPEKEAPPAEVDDQMVIAEVQGVGDVTNEVVHMRNWGSVINLQGWTLSNDRGDVFHFPEFRLTSMAIISVFSGQGSNTPAALYWGREISAWQDGDTIILADSNGVVQATFVIGAD